MTSATGGIDPGLWSHPQDIAGHLTQHPGGAASPDSANARQRCGPANLLAASIMNGREATAATLRGAARSPGLTGNEQTELRTIASNVLSDDPQHRVSYEQLSQAQALMYRAGNSERPAGRALDAVGNQIRMAMRGTDPAAAGAAALANRALSGLEPSLRNGGELSEQQHGAAQLLMNQHHQSGTLARVPDPQHAGRFNWVMQAEGTNRGDGSGFNDHELEALGSSAAGWSQRRNLADVSGRAPLSTLLGRSGLTDGQAATMRVGSAGGDPDADHFITVGRTPGGLAYLYNPDPARGDSVMATGDDAVREAARYERDHRVRADVDGDLPNAVITRPGAHGPATRHPG